MPTLSSPPRVVILGAGPAGLGAAYQLRRRGLADVVVLERNAGVGGNAGSFEVAGLRVDFGSHRLHPACDPHVLQDIRSLLGDDLLDRPRHGRIRLRGRWIHFPLKPVDMALRLPPSFAFGVAMDATGKVLTNRKPPADSANESFASVLQTGLGHTICRDFYFPYARKIWGVEPRSLSAIQARRRVSAGSISRMLRKVAAAIPGWRPPGAGRFFYPRHGYGQISEAYAAAAQQAGAEVRLGVSVTAVQLSQRAPHSVVYQRDGQTEMLQAEHVWSTIPITALARLLTPAPPEQLLAAANRLSYRAMILIYLVLEQPQFSEYDAHYFPEANIRITRLSEPKNYSATRRPADTTVLCAELPCSVDDPEWSMEDAALGEVVERSLAAACLPVRSRVRQVVTRRLRQAYPIYHRGYEAHLERLDDWLESLDGVLTFGRQGLFAHDNTHHALYMAYSAADCLTPEGQFDVARWAGYRRVFATHVVED
jgi:protoporphyrinogen oxidase